MTAETGIKTHAYNLPGTFTIAEQYLQTQYNELFWFWIKLKDKLWQELSRKIKQQKEIPSNHIEAYQFTPNVEIESSL